MEIGPGTRRFGDSRTQVGRENRCATGVAHWLKGIGLICIGTCQAQAAGTIKISHWTNSWRKGSLILAFETWQIWAVNVDPISECDVVGLCQLSCFGSGVRSSQRFQSMFATLTGN